MELLLTPLSVVVAIGGCTVVLMVCGVLFSKSSLYDLPTERECFREYYNLLQKVKYCGTTTELAALEDDIVDFFEKFKGCAEVREFTSELYAAHSNRFTLLSPFNLKA